MDMRRPGASKPRSHAMAALQCHFRPGLVALLKAFRSWRSDWRGLRLGCERPYGRLKGRLRRCLRAKCTVTDVLPQAQGPAERRALQELCSLLGEPELLAQEAGRGTLEFKPKVRRSPFRMAFGSDFYILCIYNR